MRTIIFPMALVVLLAACAPERHDGLFESLDVAEDGAATDVSFEVSEKVIPSMNGVWAKYEQTSNCVDVVGSKIENLAWSWDLFYIEEMTRDDSGRQIWIRIHAITCRKELSPIIVGMGAFVPDEVVETAEPRTFECLLMLDEEHAALGDTFDITTGKLYCQPYAELWGVTLDNPFYDEMPTTMDDPKVYDQDEDGIAGVTLILQSEIEDVCDMYVIQRSVALLEGEFTNNSHCFGYFRSFLEQIVIGGSASLCESENETFPSPDDSRDNFHFFRVDGFNASLDIDDGDGEYTCDDLRSSIDDLKAFYGIEYAEPTNGICSQ